MGLDKMPQLSIISKLEPETGLASLSQPTNERLSGPVDFGGCG